MEENSVGMDFNIFDPNDDDVFQDVGKKDRKRTYSDSSHEDTPDPKRSVLVQYPRTVVLKHIPPSRPLGQLNPIQVSRELSKYPGILNIKTVSGGRLMLTIECPSAYRKISEISKIAGSDVVLADMSVSQPSGVIHHVPLSLSDEELRNYLSSQSVVKSERFFKTRNGQKSPTYSVRLTFSTDQLPDSVKVGYNVHTVDKYVPPPLRCYSCQRYGHVAESCRSRRRCSRCGKEHAYDACPLESAATSSFHCVNCGGSHSAAYGGCPSLKRQARVNTLSVLENISRKEARVRVHTLETAVPSKVGAAVSEPPSASVPHSATVDGPPKRSYAATVSGKPSQSIQEPSSPSVLSRYLSHSAYSPANPSTSPSGIPASAPRPSVPHYNPAPIQGDLLEKLIVLIITLHFHSATDPVGDKAALYTNMVKTIFSSTINMTNVTSQLQTLIPDFNEH